MACAVHPAVATSVTVVTRRSCSATTRGWTAPIHVVGAVESPALGVGRQPHVVRTPEVQRRVDRVRAGDAEVDRVAQPVVRGARDGRAGVAESAVEQLLTVQGAVGLGDRQRHTETSLESRGQSEISDGRRAREIPRLVRQVADVDAPARQSCDGRHRQTAVHRARRRRDEDCGRHPPPLERTLGDAEPQAARVVRACQRRGARQRPDDPGARFQRGLIAHVDTVGKRRGRPSHEDRRCPRTGHLPRRRNRCESLRRPVDHEGRRRRSEAGVSNRATSRQCLHRRIPPSLVGALPAPPSAS